MSGKGMVQRGGPPPDAAPAGDAPVGQQSLPDRVAPEPGTIRSERPGPPPAPLSSGRITETYLSGRGPDVIDVNERKWSAKKAALREAALAEAAKMPKPNAHQPLFGSKLDEAPAEGEGGEAAAAEGEEAAEDTPAEPTAEERKAAELQEIAKRDRENRRLRKELKRIEGSRASDSKKLEQIKELAKTNPRGVVAYFGGKDETYLQQLRDKGDQAAEVPKIEEAAPEPAEDEEKDTLRKERDQLKYQVAVQNTDRVLGGMVTADKASRWPAVAAMGDEAVAEAREKAMKMAKDFKRTPTKKEALGVLELCLDEINEKYANIGKKVNGGTAKPAAGKPRPRNPVTVPRGNPMENRNPFRDETDPRNRPTYRELGDRSRKKFFG